MTSDRKKPSLAFWATVVVVAALSATLAYAGAYLCIVRQPAFSVVGGELLVGTRRSRIAERWAGNPEFCETFFAPAHWIDRRVRPDIWSNHPF